ncbi:hypothetical protein [Chitinophaga sp. CF418]|uniref:hypothetical protein n=1 Tax=Chitinophaga sp. CF418 TaxID=1855287 RepID=UPI0009133461|nr:hypothetical protein [Chitinophaga sp. CF418]SHN35667.1 hypothetical protein SAMN05216311_1105 [Chitinophaga sp. CF418]
MQKFISKYKNYFAISLVSVLGLYLMIKTVVMLPTDPTKVAPGDIKYKFFILLITLTLLLVSFLAWFLLKYLEDRPTRLVYYDGTNKESPFHLKLDIETILTNALKKSLIDDATGVLPEVIESRFPSINQTDSLQNDYIEQLRYEIKHSNKFSSIIKLENELKSQISRLVKNSNLNLVIGILTTVLAMSFLAIFLYGHTKMTTSIELIQYFIPRVSTVIFIEVFSFFFLKLYKNNLSEIKYFQNEITNLNFKLCALKSAIQLGDNQTAAAIMLQFAATERNFILQKGQSTERLELLKVEHKDNKNIADSIVNVVKTAKEN